MTRIHPSTQFTGPLAPLADGFAIHLVALGYVSSGLGQQRALFGHLDRWLGASGLGLTDLTPELLGQFLQARAAEGYVTKLTMHGLTPLLNYLQRAGHYVSPVPSDTEVNHIVGRFHRHLLDERGLGEATVASYLRVARLFLAARPEPLEANLAELTAGDVSSFVLARSRVLSVAAMQTVVSGMRALLRFLYAVDMTSRALAPAVPTVARRREDLPRALSVEHVKALLQGCDQATPVGVRDFAILAVLIRLGLRASEVAAMRLDDIDWAAGTLRIRGKGPREDSLPLPAEVGQAVVAYLQRGRPTCMDRRVFIRSCAPRRGLSRQAIGGLVRAASVRAGLTPHGPHQLRHTVATRLLHEGASLPEIAQLLRHQTIQTTVIYANPREFHQTRGDLVRTLLE